MQSISDKYDTDSASPLQVILTGPQIRTNNKAK